MSKVVKRMMPKTVNLTKKKRNNKQLTWLITKEYTSVKKMISFMMRQPVLILGIWICANVYK